MNTIVKSRELRKLIQDPETLVMPDAYDPLSARIIERLGFHAVQCSGFSMALSAMLPSEDELGLETNLNVTRGIVRAVSIPVMADGEDGFGGPEAIGETIRAYVNAGVVGINIEDQLHGRPGPRDVIPRDVMIEKIKEARRAAREAGNGDLVINARTDALAALADHAAGLKESAERANAYLSAGADLAFVVRVATMEEVRFLVREVRGPVSVAAGMPYNQRLLSVKALKAAGVARVSLPAIAVFSSLRAVSETLRSVRDTDDFAEILEKERLCSPEDMAELLKRE
jgi:2-methylisocitrate lyase-like PEP mutase family enzyme